jgi:hypothetical protein
MRGGSGVAFADGEARAQVFDTDVDMGVHLATGAGVGAEAIAGLVPVF